MASESESLETHQEQKLIERCWYQPTGGGGRYWHEHDGRFVTKTQTQFCRWLKVNNLKDYLDKNDHAEGRVLSEVEEFLTELETTRIVEYAGPLAGWPAGAREVNGRRFLVTKPTELICLDGIEANFDADLFDYEGHGWPTIGKFLEGLFNGQESRGDGVEDVVQLPSFLTWLQHFIRSLYNGEYTTGLALAIAGEPECGKSLLASIIREMTGRTACSPYRYMVGIDNFNGDALAATLQLIDDEISATNITARNNFGANLKMVVAPDHGIRVRSMHNDPIQVDPITRLVILCNNEPDKIQVLPPYDNDVADKMLILRGYSRPMPMPSETPAERRAFWARIASEIPHLARWLLDVYDPPRESLGRFGPKAWAHRDIVEELGKLDPAIRTQELVIQFLKRRQPRISPDQADRLSAAVRARLDPLFRNGPVMGWIGTASDLRNELMEEGDDAPLSPWQRREVRQATYLGRDLVNLSRSNPNTIIYNHTARERCWLILFEPLPDENS